MTISLKKSIWTAFLSAGLFFIGTGVGTASPISEVYEKSVAKKGGCGIVIIICRPKPRPQPRPRPRPPRPRPDPKPIPKALLG